MPTRPVGVSDLAGGAGVAEYRTRERYADFGLDATLLDDFNRANENPIVTGWTPKVVSTNGNLQVLSNTAQGQTTGSLTASAYRTGPGADFFMYADFNLPAAPSSTGVVGQLWGRIVDAGGAADGYLVQVVGDGISGTPNVLQLLKVTDGGLAFLGTGQFSFPASWGPDFTVGLRCVGNEISVWIKRNGVWTRILVGTDSAYSSNVIGIGAKTNSGGSAAKVDNVYVGTPVATAEQYLLEESERVVSARCMGASNRMQNVAGFATSNGVTLANKTGSGVLVALTELMSVWDEAVTTSVGRMVHVRRGTGAPSAGTLITPTMFDTTQSHNSNVEMRMDSSAEGNTTNNALIIPGTPVDLGKHGLWRGHTGFSQMRPQKVSLPSDLILRENEFVQVIPLLNNGQSITTMSVTNMAWEEFTLP